MTGFDVDPDALATARAEIEQVRGVLAAAAGDVTAEVTSLVGDGWRGTAATAFGDGFDEWRRGAEQVLDALATTGELLAVTQRAYEATDADAADRQLRIAGRLDGLGGAGGAV